MVSPPGVSVGFSFPLAMTLAVPCSISSPCHSELSIDMALWWHRSHILAVGITRLQQQAAKAPKLKLPTNAENNTKKLLNSIALRVCERWVPAEKRPAPNSRSLAPRLASSIWTCFVLISYTWDILFSLIASSAWLGKGCSAANTAVPPLPAQPTPSLWSCQVGRLPCGVCFCQGDVEIIGWFFKDLQWLLMFLTGAGQRKKVAWETLSGSENWIL